MEEINMYQLNFFYFFDMSRV